METARIRNAYLVATRVIEATNATGKQPTTTNPINMEAPLPENEKISMMDNWTRRYNITLSMYMDPADPMANRLYHEFYQNIPTLIPVEKVKSIFQGDNPSPEQRHPLPGGIFVTVQVGPDEIIRDAFA